MGERKVITEKGNIYKKENPDDHRKLIINKQDILASWEYYFSKIAIKTKSCLEEVNREAEYKNYTKELTISVYQPSSLNYMERYY